MAAGRMDSDAAPGESTALQARFYGCIRVFLVLSMLLLAVEVAAYIQGWHLEMLGLLTAAYAGWMRVRLQYLAPPLQFLTNACVVLFLIQSVDRLVLCLGCLWIKLKGIKPVPIADDKADVEAADEDFPMVLVQMPMCNEREGRRPLPPPARGDRCRHSTLRLRGRQYSIPLAQGHRGGWRRLQNLPPARSL